MLYRDGGWPARWHPDDAKRYLDMGVKDFCLGTDVVVWMQWLKKNGEEMKKALE